MAGVFVTVGSQKFPFDRLVRAVDCLAATGELGDAFVQTGACSYVPVHCESAPFLDREEFAERMEAADLVVTHAGTGAIIGALRRSKRVVAVPREARHGEHVDDHQVEIVRQFAGMGLIEPCWDVENLGAACERARTGAYRAYESNTDRFVADLAAYLDEIGGLR